MFGETNETARQGRERKGLIHCFYRTGKGRREDSRQRERQEEKHEDKTGRQTDRHEGGRINKQTDEQEDCTPVNLPSMPQIIY